MNAASRQVRPACKLTRQSFNFNGRDTFLYSGEVHYFRIPVKYWRKHLQALVDAGCNAVSTYVPWSWHEISDNRFDLTGRTHPERDLLGFVDLAAELGLFITLKPGPYVMAETTDQGIPGWLTEAHPEVLAINAEGRPWGPCYVSLPHPLFRAKAARWLTLFAKQVVVPRQSRKRGAVAMLQLCNEIGIFEWLGAHGDYAPATLAAWHAYLQREFPDRVALARLLDRELGAYTDVPAPRGDCANRRDFVLYRLWHDFFRNVYGEYVKFLSDTLRAAGVTAPFFTNVGGWVYGRAHEFLLNATFHRKTRQLCPEVIYGLDHIPEFVSPLNTHDGLLANEIAAELQGRRGPLYSAELQCGSREHGVQPYPDELGLFYRLCLIHGLTGMNFYMFSQGRNPKGRGTDGPMFYWYNALDWQGNRLPTFSMIQELGRWLGHNGDFLCRATRPAELGVGFYPHLYETEFLVPILFKDTRLHPQQLGLSLDPVGFRDRAYFDGVLRILTKQSVPFQLTDLTARSAAELRKNRRLVVLINEMMDAATQTKLADYVQAGGELVIFPTLPTYDLNFEPCTILRDRLGIKIIGRARSNRIYMDKLKDIPVPATPWLLSERGARVLARDADGNVVGIEKSYGRGIVRHFGFFVQYSIEEHPALWSAMMDLPQVARNAWADSDNLHLECRFNDGEGLLFVGNFHRMPMAARIQARNPRGGVALDLGRIELPGLRGLMLPLQTRLGGGLTLVYAHAELVGCRKTGDNIRLALRGIKGMPGRLVFKTAAAGLRITVDGQLANVARAGDRIIVDYIQTGAEQVVEVGRGR